LYKTIVLYNNVLRDDGPVRSETDRNLMFLKILLWI